MATDEQQPSEDLTLWRNPSANLAEFFRLLYFNKSIRNRNCHTRKRFYANLDKLNCHKWNILDFLVYLVEDFNNESIILFKNYVDKELEKTKKYYNYEFRFKSAECIVYFCKRNEPFLFELFFPFAEFSNFIKSFKIEPNKTNIYPFWKRDNLFLYGFFYRSRR